MPIFKRHYTALPFEKQDEKFQYGIQGDERMKQSAFRYAFPKTIPVLVGYLFLGAADGILMKVNGFGLFWSAALSLFVYAGSLQYAGAVSYTHLDVYKRQPDLPPALWQLRLP